MKYLFIGMIRLYQWTIGPLVGECCRFEPSCSEYARMALQKYGVFKGLWLTVRRLIKCHPWHPGGIDHP